MEAEFEAVGETAWQNVAAEVAIETTNEKG